MEDENKTNKKEENFRIIDEIVKGIVEKALDGEDGEYIYRGQSDATHSVTSTLYRAMVDSYPKIKGAKWVDMNRVQGEALESARRYSSEDYDKDDEKMLSRIQHYSGDTNLIDFTKDCLVALFFACSQTYGKKNDKRKRGKKASKNNDGAGKVFLLKTSSLKNSKIKMIDPVHPFNRVTAQKSVFVQPPTGIIDDDMMDTVEIPLELKQVALEYLKTYHGISEYTIYNDLHGYIRNRKEHGNAVMEFYMGLNYGYKGDSIKTPKRRNNTVKKAIECFNKAIRLAPNYAMAYSNRGAAKWRLGEKQGAMEDFDKAIELDVNYAKAYYNRGGAKRESGKVQDAINDFDKAIELDPKYVTAYYNRGDVKRKSGKVLDAIRDYDKAIELDPKYAEAYYNRGGAKRESGKVQDAINDFDKAIELDPKYVTAYYNRGDVKRKSGKVLDAIRDYDKAIELDPKYAEAYYDRGDAKRKLGDVQDAINDFNGAIKFDSNYAEAYYKRGLAKEELGDRNDIRKSVRERNFQQAILDFKIAKRLARRQNKQDIADEAQESIERIKIKISKL